MRLLGELWVAKLVKSLRDALSVLRARLDENIDVLRRAGPPVDLLAQWAKRAADVQARTPGTDPSCVARRSFATVVSHGRLAFRFP
jgi:hypothetical protein